MRLPTLPQIAPLVSARQHVCPLCGEYAYNAHLRGCPTCRGIDPRGNGDERAMCLCGAPITNGRNRDGLCDTCAAEQPLRNPGCRHCSENCHRLPDSSACRVRRSRRARGLA